MIDDPLTELQNGEISRRKVVRTYGKRRGKDLASQEKGFEVLLVNDGLESALSQLRLDEQENWKLVNICKEAKCQSEDAACQNVAHSRPPAGLQSSSPKKQHKKSHRVKDVDDTKWLRPLLELSERPIMDFSAYSAKLDKAYMVQKVGEGSFSSVFSLNRRSSNATAQEQSILKIIPIKTPSSKQETGHTQVQDIVNELQTMNVLDEVPGFLRYRGLVVIQGAWPQKFLGAFREFSKRCRSKALNEDPETAYLSSQHYAVVEMGFAGQELDDIARPSDFQIYDVFWMTTIHLALAEERLGFEHRDLHVSNICIQAANKSESRTDVLPQTARQMKERPQNILGLTNIELTLIDYTYSRTSQSAESADFRKRDGDFPDEDEEQISNERKRKEAELQQVAYDKASECLEAARTGRDSYESIHVFVPRTNVCWLAYLIQILLGRAGKIARTKYVQGSSDVAKAFQDEIRGILKNVAQSLSCPTVDELPESALEVLNMGLDRGWLSKSDVDAFRLRLESCE